MSTDGQVLLLAGHCQRGQRECPIIEGQLEGHMDRVEQDLLPHQLDVHLLVVEVACHLPDLPHCVVNEAAPLGAIMKGQTLLRFIFTNEAGGSHPRIWELQILMQVVQAVEEVAHVTTQDGQNAIVSILTDKAHEVDAHLVHEISFRDT